MKYLNCISYDSGSFIWSIKIFYAFPSFFSGWYAHSFIDIIMNDKFEMKVTDNAIKIRSLFIYLALHATNVTTASNIKQMTPRCQHFIYERYIFKLYINDRIRWSYKKHKIPKYSNNSANEFCVRYLENAIIWRMDFRSTAWKHNMNGYFLWKVDAVNAACMMSV